MPLESAGNVQFQQYGAHKGCGQPGFPDQQIDRDRCGAQKRKNAGPFPVQRRCIQLPGRWVHGRCVLRFSERRLPDMTQPFQNIVGRFDKRCTLPDQSVAAP